MENFQLVNNLPVLAAGHDIQLLGYSGKQYVDAETIGRKLGYQYPLESINKLWQRHRNEFKDDETLEVKLTFEVGASGRSRNGHLQAVKHRLFSVPKGAFRLCMISNAPNRVDVQDQILQVFDSYRFGSLIRGSEMGPMLLTESYIKEIKQRLGTYTGNRVVKDLMSGCFDGQVHFMPLEEIAKMPEGPARCAAIMQYAKAQGKSRGQAYKIVAQYKAAVGIVKGATKKTGQPRRTRSDAGQVKNEDERQKALVYRSEYPQAHGKEIRTALKLRTSEANINRWLRAA